MEVIVTVIVMVDTLEHTTVTGGVVVVVVTVTLDIMRNTVQRKTSIIIPVHGSRNPSRVG